MKEWGNLGRDLQTVVLISDGQVWFSATATADTWSAFWRRLEKAKEMATRANPEGSRGSLISRMERCTNELETTSRAALDRDWNCPASTRMLGGQVMANRAISAPCHWIRSIDVIEVLRKLQAPPLSIWQRLAASIGAMERIGEVSVLACIFAVVWFAMKFV